ncbi:regulatory YrvL family protein [Caldibacillus lycopersici]|uniref:Regulatory YrvL family protein n=1 Tax=Perspicuibacillus lycopersici TaxID=1325689 RepID=A0AAE3ITP4_9BACI|nr:regulatory YrvL family protein [Perspicuibacillus lycopersici]MCU9611940.1 regulatory YrvL family protein [Perspicuibacillus lycopersici]
MANKKEGSLKSQSLPLKIFIFISLGFIGIITFAAILAVYFFGVKGLFTLTGVSYHSIFTIVKFLIYCFLFGLITDIVLLTFKVLFMLFPLQAYQIQLLLFLTNTYLSWLVVHFVDYWMINIAIDTWIEIIGAILLAAIDYIIDFNKEKMID